MAETNSDNPTFCFVPGRHHGPETWIYVQDELREEGWNSIAPSLPIENKNANLNDHAWLVTQAEHNSGANEIIRVGWSWGANIIPRSVGLTAVKKLVFIAGAFHQATLRHKVDGKIPNTEHSLTYDALEKNPDKGFEEMAEYVFYHDVEDKMLRALLVGGFRQHPRRELEPQLAKFPDLPLEYIKLNNDRAIRPESQEEIAAALGIVPHDFEGGHAFMFSKRKAKKLAHMLIDLAKKDEPSRKLLLEAY